MATANQGAYAAICRASDFELHESREMPMCFAHIIIMIITRGEGGQRLPSPLVQVAGATLISSEEVVFSEFIQLSVISISRVS